MYKINNTYTWNITQQIKNTLLLCHSYFNTPPKKLYIHSIIYISINLNNKYVILIKTNTYIVICKKIYIKLNGCFISSSKRFVNLFLLNNLFLNSKLIFELDEAYYIIKDVIG